MVNTLTNDLKQALEIGEIIKGVINDKERIIKIEIDYVFKNMLLLKKKKYAGLKYENAIELRNNNFVGEPAFKKEFKGLDMVRRDWCDLSKEVGIYIMDLLLTSEKPKEEIINLIYDYLRQINLKMNTGNIPKEKYVISKQLVKNIDQYHDLNLLPHLKVARRLREKGDLSINSGSIINYIICNLDNIKSNKKISEKAFHLNELKENRNLEIDIIWYKENQLLMSVNRLLKHIKEVQMEMLVDCLELNKSKYVIKEQTNIELIGHEKDLIHNIFSVTLMYARNGISIQCEHCGNIMRIIKIDESNDNIREMLFCYLCKSELGNMVKLMNIISLHCKKLVSKYYYGHKICSKCRDSTRIFLKEK
jgi:DNA polymerase alpha subunit A